MVASQRACAICQGPLDGRKREACSDACRRQLNRRRLAEDSRRREQALEAQVEALEKANRELLAVVRAVGWLAKVSEGRHGVGA